jgi:hypothetical protein
MGGISCSLDSVNPIIGITPHNCRRMEKKSKNNLEDLSEKSFGRNKKTTSMN